MSFKNKDEFKLSIPQDIAEDLKRAKKERIKYLKNNIKTQYEELYKSQEDGITENNQKIVENIILETKDLIDNCIKDSNYNGNRDENFVNLTYLYHKIDLRLETYKLESKIANIEKESIKAQKEQTELKKNSENLVYNILGFIASFSIVSAAVSAIQNINGMLNVVLFMAFSAFILLTTLIGLHNFYKSNNDNKKKLQNNYFLWKMMFGVIIIILIYKGIIYIRDNQQEIFEAIGRGIGQTMHIKELNNTSDKP